MSGNSDLKNVDVANDPVVALPGEWIVLSFYSKAAASVYTSSYSLCSTIRIFVLLILIIFSEFTIPSHYAVKKLSASASTFVPGAGFGGGEDENIYMMEVGSTQKNMLRLEQVGVFYDYGRDKMCHT